MIGANPCDIDQIALQHAECDPRRDPGIDPALPPACKMSNPAVAAGGNAPRRSCVRNGG